MRDFEVSVSGLHKGSERLAEFALEGRIPGLFVTSSRIRDDELISVEGRVEAVGEGLLVSLMVWTRYEGECIRCLGAVSDELVGTARELFVQGDDGDEQYGYRGEVLDLTSAVGDLCVLLLPPAPLCAPDCKGLCQYCGADLNVETCTCDGDGGDPRWAALDGL